MATKLSYEEFKTSLEQFIGTEKYYKVGFTPIVCTDGIKYFADTCECYWLLDTITYKLYKTWKSLLFASMDAASWHSFTMVGLSRTEVPGCGL